MRLKALLTLLILATALAFFHKEEKITISYSQEEVVPEGAVTKPEPSPLQPAATVSAEELKKLEESEIDIPLSIEEATATKGFVPLRYRLLGWQILGIKIIPLFAALSTMLILSVVLNAVRRAFLRGKSLILEENEQKEPQEEKPRRRGRPPKSAANEPLLKDEKSAASGRTTRKKRGRPPKKRPRGRPRKTI